MLWVIALVQFVNILDFMMVMPLGPDFSRELGIAPAHLGIVGGSYTASACVVGVAGSTFLDRFDRKKAFVLSIVGLALGTAVGAFAWNLESLLAARILAGAFGGPATALAFSIVSDRIPAGRRGQAMSFVMGAFSLASVLGVPAGLELATWGSWRTPFQAVGFAGLVVAVAAAVMLPPMREHLQQERTKISGLELFRRPAVLLACGLTLVVTVSRFSVIPSISPFVLFNMGVARDDLGMLYMVGGIASLAVLRVAGRLVDRVGATSVFAVSTVGIILTMGLCFIPEQSVIPPWALFPVFMGVTSLGNVAVQTNSTKVPDPQERARFQSAQSAVQHLGAALGALVGAMVLDAEVTEKLVGMDRLAMFSMAMLLPTPLVLARLEALIRVRARTTS